MDLQGQFGDTLTAKSFNLALDFFYNGGSGANAEFGRNRSSSVGCQITSSASGQGVTLVQGNFYPLHFTVAGTSGGITTYTSSSTDGVVSTLSFDGTAFTEYRPDGMKLTYQAQVGGGDPVAHQLTRVQNAAGVAQTYVYGSGAEAGLLKTITTPGGRVMTFVYSASTGTSLISAIQDWGGRTWTFQYDASRNLTTYQSPSGCIRKYSYDGSNRLSVFEDARGYQTSYTYFGKSGTTAMKAGSATWTWTNSSDTCVLSRPSEALTTFSRWLSNLTSIEYPEGYTSTLDFVNRVKVAQDEPAGSQCSLTYDTLLWVPTASVDALDNRTTMAYDAFGNLTTLTNALNEVSTFGYDGSGSTRLRIRATDALGRVTSYTYNGDGLTSTMTDPRGLVTTFNYDTYGNVASMVSSSGGITELVNINETVCCR
nr:hypothetical protein [Armatimonas sp.]